MKAWGESIKLVHHYGARLLEWSSIKARMRGSASDTNKHQSSEHIDFEDDSDSDQQAEQSGAGAANEGSEGEGSSQKRPKKKRKSKKDKDCMGTVELDSGEHKCRRHEEEDIIQMETACHNHGQE